MFQLLLSHFELLTLLIVSVMSLPEVFAGNPSNRSFTRPDRVWEQSEFFGKPTDRRKYNNSIWMRRYNDKRVVPKKFIYSKVGGIQIFTAI